MTPRRPNLDFSKAHAHWAANPDFAQAHNATSIPIPYIERFLNKVMARAAAGLNGEDEASRNLRSDIRAFIKQESNHYSLHDSFNAALHREGYPLAPVEEMMEAHYDRLWKTRSLEFCLAYCEGFETLGPPSADLLLDGLEEEFSSADPEVVALWKWHVMEEFEHRTVCHDAFHHFHGGYILRVHAFFRQVWDLAGLVARAHAALIEKDRAGMTPEQIALSKRRTRKAFIKLSKAFAIASLRALSPWYNPRRLREPRSYRAVMQAIDSRLA